MWKKFALTSVCFQIAFIIINALIFWGMRGEINFEEGDLLRIGYMGNRYGNYHTEIKKQSNITKTEYIEMRDFNEANSKFDVVVVGDSFSQQGKYGYQNFIANAGYKVLNVPCYKYCNQISTVLLLHQIDFFKKNGVKFVVIEIVERGLGGSNKLPEIKFDVSYEDVIKKYSNRSEMIPENEFFVNLGNFKFLLFSVLRNFSPNAFFSEAYSMEMSGKLFSTGVNELLFYRDDVNHNLFKRNKNTVRGLLETLNSLESKLKQDGVKLIFLPAVNKYNLYNDFVIKSLGVFDLFPILREFKGNYYFCDSKKILSQKVLKGEKDIFYADDTHWSWKASKYVAEDIIKFISNFNAQD